MKKEKVISLEDRVPKLKKARRRKANRTLIILLLLFFSLICLVIYFQSPLSHIGNLSVTGNHYYTQDEIIKQSSLSKDTNIWNLRKKEVTAQLEDLQQLKSAKLKLQFPNNVIIEVEEYERIAHVMIDNYFFPVLENGTIYEEDKMEHITSDGILLFQFEDGPILEDVINKIQQLPDEILNAISEIHYAPTKMDKNHLVLFMNDGFEVSATIRSFADKMIHYPSIVGQLDPNKKGLIDLEVGSFFREYEALNTEGEIDENER